jgi:hypothetical protein
MEHWRHSAGYVDMLPVRESSRSVSWSKLTLEKYGMHVCTCCGTVPLLVFGPVHVKV